MVSGTPSAVPLAPPKLDRMSLRTTPLWLRTSGPFDPPPGYGPAVSSGIGSQLAAAAEELAPWLLADGGADPSTLGPHAARSPALTPVRLISFNAWRRSTIVARS